MLFFLLSLTGFHPLSQGGCACWHSRAGQGAVDFNHGPSFSCPRSLQGKTLAVVHMYASALKEVAYVALRQRLLFQYQPNKPAIMPNQVGLAAMLCMVCMRAVRAVCGRQP